jgi:hypothetical protein
MALFKTTGRIYRKDEVVEGESSRGSWLRQNVVLVCEADIEHPWYVSLTAFGEKTVGALTTLPEGAQVNVSFSINAREYNGRYYNDLRIWEIAPVAPAPAPAPVRPTTQAILDGTAAPGTDDDLPFRQSPLV